MSIQFISIENLFLKGSVIVMNSKRGYKRYMDFNHNRMVLLVKEWYGSKLMIDFYYNEQFLGYVIAEAVWADIFNSDSSNSLIISLMHGCDKLEEYIPVFLSMNLFEENLLFIDEYFGLELYVSVPFHRQALLKVCKRSDSKEKKVLHQCSLDAYSYNDIFDSCMRYLRGLYQLQVQLCSNTR